MEDTWPGPGRAMAFLIQAPGQKPASASKRHNYPRVKGQCGALGSLSCGLHPSLPPHPGAASSLALGGFPGQQFTLAASQSPTKFSKDFWGYRRHLQTRVDL